MDEDGRRAAGPLEMGSERVEAFSDGVMAVIITILALELRPPAGPTLHALHEEWPSLLIYVLAFTFIAIYWNNHHHLLRATTRISGAVMWANMFLLFCLSLIPVTTEWLRTAPSEPLPAAAFGVVCLLAGFAYFLLVHAIVRVNGRDSLVGTAIASDIKGNASIAIYAAGIGLAYVEVWIAYTLYATVAVMWMVPDRRFTRSARANDSSEREERPA